MPEVENFSKRFGKDFQENLLALIIKDRLFSDQIREVLDVNYFEYKSLRLLCKQIFDYKEKYKEHPKKEIIETLLKTELNRETETDRIKVNELFHRIFSLNKIDNQEFIKDQSLQFCKKQVLKEAMLESINFLEKASFDEISETINNALKKGLDNNLGYDFILDFEARYLKKSRNSISTGFETIDKLTKGGPGKGELCIIIAPSGAGKSFWLVWIGSQALKLGKNVVHYTLELSDKHVGNRYDSCITGISLNDIYFRKEEVYKKIKEIQGRLIIKEYPTKSITIKGLKTHLEKVQQKGMSIDLIIVDYPDLLRSSSQYKDKRFELESIFEELRSIGQYFECPLWAASQTNRSGLNEEIVSTSSISESFAKVFTADFIVTLSRTKEDRAANTGKLFVAKNRNGPDGMVFPIHFDPSFAFFEIEEKSKQNSSQQNQLQKNFS